MNPGKSRSRGFSVPELVVAMGLFLLLMAMTSTCFVQCVRAYRQNQEKAPVFRHVAIGAALIARELRMCEKIYYPEREEDFELSFYPKKGETPPFLFLLDKGGAKELVAYTLAEKTKTLERALYEIEPLPTADPKEALEIVVYPEDPPPLVERLKLKEPFRPIGHDVGLLGLKFLRKGTDKFLEMRIYPAGEEADLLETKVYLRRGYEE